MTYRQGLFLRSRQTQQKILMAAVQAAEESNFWLVRRYDIAKRANCAPSLVSHHFGSVSALRGRMFKEALRVHNHKVIVQAVCGGPLDLPAMDLNLIEISFAKVAECLILQLRN